MSRQEREEELRRIEWECAQLAAPRQEDVSPEDNEMACTASKSEKQEEVPKKKDEDKVAESPDQDGGNLPPLPAPLQDEQGERLMTEAKESKERLQKLKEQLEEAESQEARRKKRLIKVSSLAMSIISLWLRWHVLGREKRRQGWRKEAKGAC